MWQPPHTGIGKNVSGGGCAVGGGAFDVLLRFLVVVYGRGSYVDSGGTRVRCFIRLHFLSRLPRHRSAHSRQHSLRPVRSLRRPFRLRTPLRDSITTPLVRRTADSWRVMTSTALMDCTPLSELRTKSLALALTPVAVLLRTTMSGPRTTACVKSNSRCRLVEKPPLCLWILLLRLRLSPLTNPLVPIQW